MLIWVKDCVFYRSNTIITMDQLIKNLTSGIFDKFEKKNITDSIVEIKYSWLDSIKIRDKVITRKPKSSKAWVFINTRNIVFFGTSESELNYLKVKLQTLLNIEIVAIDIFSSWKKNYFSKNNWFAKLISIHIKNEIIPYDDSLIRKISIDHIEFEYLKMYLNNKPSYVSNLTFLFDKKEKVYFYMDLQSVISFPDTIKADEIVMILNEVLNEL